MMNIKYPIFNPAMSVNEKKEINGLPQIGKNVYKKNNLWLNAFSYL
jgi:hypothetical protein